jgi:alpha-glucosidase
VHNPSLPVDATLASAAEQTSDPASFLFLYRKLLRLRRRERALSLGSYREIARTDRVLTYEREHGGRRAHVALNLGSSPQPLPPALEAGYALLSTIDDTAKDRRNHLDGNEAVILEPP